MTEVMLNKRAHWRAAILAVLVPLEPRVNSLARHSEEVSNRLHANAPLGQGLDDGAQLPAR